MCLYLHTHALCPDVDSEVLDLSGGCCSVVSVQDSASRAFLKTVYVPDTQRPVGTLLHMYQDADLL